MIKHTENDIHSAKYRPDVVNYTDRFCSKHPTQENSHLNIATKEMICKKCSLKVKCVCLVEIVNQARAKLFDTQNLLNSMVVDDRDMMEQTNKNTRIMRDAEEDFEDFVIKSQGDILDNAHLQK